MFSNNVSHWDHLAQQWRWLTSPLRPAPDDIRIYLRLLGKYRPAIHHDTLQVLLLGVTPEIATMEWPPGTELLACDRSQAMIQHIWPGDTTAATTLCADWCDLPLPHHFRDIIIGDGCLTVLSFSHSLRSFADSIKRVIRPDGLLLLRIFCRPEVSESIGDIVAAFNRGEISNPHILRWRLAMSLHCGIEQGVRLNDIWEAWHGFFPSPADMGRMTGWEREAIATIEAYQDVQTHYLFPTLSEAVTLFEDKFELLETVLPSYELGERCPIVALRRRNVS